MSIDINSDLFQNLRREFVATVRRIPVIAAPGGNDLLLNGLPSDALLRLPANPMGDLNNIVNGFGNLGRLGAGRGVRPLVALVENALEYASPPAGEVATSLQRLGRSFADLYDRDPQPVAAPAASGTPEALIFGAQRDNRLPFEFLEGALRTCRALARISVPRLFGSVADGTGVFGTGWLVAPGLLLTNHHVIGARLDGEASVDAKDLADQAERIEVWFDYHQERNVEPTCTGARVLVVNRSLDFALLELLQPERVRDREALPVVATQPALARGARLNIVQYPRGGALRMAIRNNFFVQTGASPEFLRYQTDTEPGASGSPVCDDNWQVIALHHARVFVPPRRVPQEVIDLLGADVVYSSVLNEAVAIHAVLGQLPVDLLGQIVRGRSA